MKGWVYVISNKAHGFVKVGYTERDPKARAKELDGTSSPYPHVVEYALLVEAPRQLERHVHKKLAAQRVSRDREFFDCSVAEAVKAITDLAGDSFLYEDRSFGVQHQTQTDRSNLSNAHSSIEGIKLHLRRNNSYKPKKYKHKLIDVNNDEKSTSGNISSKGGNFGCLWIILGLYLIGLLLGE